MSNNQKFTAGLAIEFGKARIALPIALSALTGYFLEKGSLDTGFLFPFSGVFFLACGSMAMNQVQEQNIDRLMDRTMNRPIPSGRSSAKSVIIYSVICFIAGLLLLSGSFSALVLGAVTALYYNLVYTPLKRVTAFAAVPGAIVGALPPMVGWASANGNLSDHRIWLLASFFFMGQIPHFWLLLLMYGKDYEKAGLPTLTKIMSETQIKRLTFSWILWTGIVAVFLAFLGVVKNTWTAWTLVALSIGMIILFLDLMKRSKIIRNFRPYFIKLNIFYSLVMILLWLDSLL